MYLKLWNISSYIDKDCVDDIRNSMISAEKEGAVQFVATDSDGDDCTFFLGLYKKDNLVAITPSKTPGVVLLQFTDMDKISFFANSIEDALIKLEECTVINIRRF